MHYAIDDPNFLRVKLIQYISKNSSDGGGWKFCFQENVGNVSSVLKLDDFCTYPSVTMTYLQPQLISLCHVHYIPMYQG
jgi:hypothetical protein